MLRHKSILAFRVVKSGGITPFPPEISQYSEAMRKADCLSSWYTRELPTSRGLARPILGPTFRHRHPPAREAIYVRGQKGGYHVDLNPFVVIQRVRTHLAGKGQPSAGSKPSRVIGTRNAIV